MYKNIDGYTATQTDKGYKVVLHGSSQEVDITVEDIEEFANKYSSDMLMGAENKLNDKEELIFSVWQMVLIPNDVKH